MSLPIITASERMKQRSGIKAAIFGPSGIGKTTLLKTLPPESTLFFDLEAGDLAVEGWTGDTIQPRTWEECRNFAVFIGGPNPSLRDDQCYSKAHYDAICEKFGDPASMEKYGTIFIDSITVAGRLCFQWAQGQPDAVSEKSGKPDMRGAYGLHGREMLAWLSHLQHTRAKNIIFLGILEPKEDDFGRKTWVPQIDGSKVGRELPGIVDEVITMQSVKGEEGSFRAFFTDSLNAQGYPAKDRSGRLDAMEEPHLGKLFEKIKSGVRAENLDHSIPDQTVKSTEDTDMKEAA